MMHKNILILYCCLLGCFFSCQKETALIENLPSKIPVFFITGTIGEEDLNLVAGDNDFFMFTSYEASDSSFQLTGELAHESGCATDCRSLTIILHNYLPGNMIETSGIPTDSTINFPVSPPQSINSISQFEYTFTADNPEDDIISHSWEFLTLDNTLLAPAKGASVTIQQDSSMNFKAKLTTAFTYGCMASAERRIEPLLNATNDCNCNIMVSEDSSVYPILHTDCTAEYVWNGSVYEDTIETNSQEEENCLELYDDQGGFYCISCVQSYALPNQEILEICNTGFTYEATPLTIVQNEKIPYVSVVYKNADNLTFSSDFALQPDDAFLYILNAQPYERNAANQVTQLLEIGLTAKLKAENSTATFPINIQGNFGVAYPD